MSDWPDDWRRDSPSRVCPRCGALAVRPVLFGMPAIEVVDAVKSGEISIVIGGCVLPWAPVSCGCLACNEMLVETPAGALVTDDEWAESEG